MDVLGFLYDHGIGLGNSALIVVVYKLIANRLLGAEKKVNMLWDWYNQQKGKEQQHNQHRRDDDE